MKKLHKDILKILTQDCRTDCKSIAAMLGEDEGSVGKAVAEMENGGIILKYGVVVDEEKIDRDAVQAIIEVKVTPKSAKGFDEIAADVGAFEEVKSLYLTSGGFDLCIVIEGRTLREVAMFVSEKLSRLDSVLSTSTHFILKKYKVDGVSFGGDSQQRLVIQP